MEHQSPEGPGWWTSPSLPRLTRPYRWRVRSGGIIVAIKDNIAKHINVIDTDCKFIMWLKISKVLFNVDKDVICGVVYIPPETSKYSSNDSFMEI